MFCADVPEAPLIRDSVVCRWAAFSDHPRFIQQYNQFLGFHQVVQFCERWERHGYAGIEIIKVCKAVTVWSSAIKLLCNLRPKSFALPFCQPEDLLHVAIQHHHLLILITPIDSDRGQPQRVVARVFCLFTCRFVRAFRNPFHFSIQSLVILLAPLPFCYKLDALDRRFQTGKLGGEISSGTPISSSRSIVWKNASLPVRQMISH
ncbi:unnamed protein product [Mycena citricolor]|uniref:Uncharacterized protein n=1 Tax=Mycena citricolor TaxID=2018698 RepID=A0AAD2Q509_9AGAR|nr:unnamed protein product [Mycena citricolor]